jgi:cytidine deaminase
MAVADASDAELLAQARAVAARAYVPYSHFRVGAAVRDAAGQTFVGCNVESASYGLTTCAERVAVFAAVAAGASRPFAGLALACVDAAEPSGCSPCGACRQVLAEHLTADAPILIEGRGSYTLAELLPLAFELPPA